MANEAIDGARSVNTGDDSLERLNLDQVESYEFNPRRAPNPRYEEIRTSALAMGGLHTYPVLTQPDPAVDRFVTRAGGGTRIAVLRDLWESTGRECFFWARWRVVPWPGELALKVDHAGENMLRANMSFIDKAQALENIALQIRADHPSMHDASLRDMANAITEAGQPVSHTQYRAALYAIGRLEPIIPEALHKGMLGRTVVEKIQSLDGSSEARVRNGDPTLLEEFEAVFVDALRTCDGPDFSLPAVERRIEQFLARHFPSKRRPPSKRRSSAAKTRAGRAAPAQNAATSEQRLPVPASLRELRYKASAIALELVQLAELLPSYGVLEDGTLCLGFEMGDLRMSGLDEHPADPRRLAIGHYLYCVFWAAALVEHEAGLMAHIDWSAFASVHAPPVVARQEAYEDGRAFEAGAALAALRARVGAGLGDEIDRKAMTLIHTLDHYAGHHMRLVGERRADANVPDEALVEESA